jgi:hypothetical protein
LQIVAESGGRIRAREAVVLATNSPININGVAACHAPTPSHLVLMLMDDLSQLP